MKKRRLTKRLRRFEFTGGREKHELEWNTEAGKENKIGRHMKAGFEISEEKSIASASPRSAAAWDG